MLSIQCSIQWPVNCKNVSLSPTAQSWRESEHFTLKASPFYKKRLFFSFAKIFGSNVDDLANELDQIKRVLERKEKSGMQRLTTLLEFVVFLEPFKEVFRELFRPGRTAIVITVSSASCERSFSAQRLIKNHPRTESSWVAEHWAPMSKRIRHVWVCKTVQFPSQKPKNNAVAVEQNVQQSPTWNFVYVMCMREMFCTDSICEHVKRF